MRYRREQNHYLLVLDKGDELVQSVTDFVKSEELSGGTIRGLGGVTNIELGFFDTLKKEYLRKKFEGFFELANLVGDISLVDGKPFCHLHAVISDAEMRTYAGHLFAAEISVTGEIIVTPGEKVERRLNNDIGLSLLDF
jgi:predicted DNA-binding protein with PD1-like motif